MQIGRQVLMSDPNSSENACYALVLPLLHLHGRGDDWEQAELLLALFSPAMLDVLSRFALLQVERPEAAMAVAQYMAEATDKEFSPVQWALDAAEACVADHRPDLAERLLRTTVSRTEDRDSAAKLRLKIAEGYAQCGDHETAAQICERIVVDLPDTSLYGRIKAMRLGYLAREDKIEQVIAETGVALQEPGCKSHLPQILYLRWWALRKANRLEEALEIARVLVERCPTNPCVAPVLLARATDALARQEYDACRELLTRLTEDFPETESARRAADILSRLKGSVVE
jgi:tetratricopeptide (TPR) repeat protein